MICKGHFIATVIFILMFAIPGFAQDNIITIAGSSNVRDWSCSAPADVLIGFDDPAQPVMGFPSGVSDFEVAIQVFSLICDDDDKGKVSRMENHLRGAMKADDYPDIHFEMTGYSLNASDAVSVAGELTITKVTRNVEFDVVLVELPDGSGLVVSGTTDIIMTDYDVEPPSLAFGMIKALDVVTVKFEVVLGY